MNTRSMSTDAERDKYAKLIGQLKYICHFLFQFMKIILTFLSKIIFIFYYNIHTTLTTSIPEPRKHAVD